MKIQVEPRRKIATGTPASWGESSSFTNQSTEQRKLSKLYQIVSFSLIPPSFIMPCSSSPAPQSNRYLFHRPIELLLGHNLVSRNRTRPFHSGGYLGRRFEEEWTE